MADDRRGVTRSSSNPILAPTIPVDCAGRTLYHRGDHARTARRASLAAFAEFPRSMTILIQVSPGELIDKMTILEVKLEQMSDPVKIANVRREHDMITRTF